MFSIFYFDKWNIDWLTTLLVPAREYSCIHSVGDVIILGTMIPPYSARVTLLGKKRTRGSAALHRTKHVHTYVLYA